MQYEVENGLLLDHPNVKCKSVPNIIIKIVLIISNFKIELFLGIYNSSLYVYIIKSFNVLRTKLKNQRFFSKFVRAPNLWNKFVCKVFYIIEKSVWLSYYIKNNCQTLYKFGKN